MQVVIQCWEYWVKFYNHVNYEREQDIDDSLCWHKFYDLSSLCGVPGAQTYWHFKVVGPLGIFESSGLLL